MLKSLWESQNEHRTFTTEELAKMFNTTPPSINLIKRRLNIVTEYTKTNGVKHNVFKYSDYLQFKNFFAIQKAKGRVIEEDLDKIRNKGVIETKASKLVTDPRCFNLSWFPDIIPVCLADIWELT